MDVPDSSWSGRYIASNVDHNIRTAVKVFHLMRSGMVWLAGRWVVSMCQGRTVRNTTQRQDLYKTGKTVLMTIIHLKMSDTFKVCPSRSSTPHSLPVFKPNGQGHEVLALGEKHVFAPEGSFSPDFISLLGFGNGGTERNGMRPGRGTKSGKVRKGALHLASIPRALRFQISGPGLG